MLITGNGKRHINLFRLKLGGMRFQGCFTAIVTPFKGSGIRPPIDWSALERLIEFQDGGGVSGLVACGSTGESATLSMDEHNQVIEFVHEKSSGLTIAGTGSNSTWEAVEMTCHAADVGVAASLQVCPYYNKPNQEGLYLHFSEVARSVDIPIILYNVPSRSGISIKPETMARLAREHSNIVAVKEASAERSVWQAIRDVCPPEFQLLSGNDENTLEMMRDFGASGVISVASNILPREIREMVEKGLKGDFQAMEKDQKRYLDAFNVLFRDTNPIPIKHILNKRGYGVGGYRLPLTETSEEIKKEIEAVFQELLG